MTKTVPRPLKILILSQHFPPEPITRLRDLTAHLVAQGHQVEVLTTFPSYPLGRIYDGYQLALHLREQTLGAQITRVFAVPYRGAAKGKRLISYGSFAFFALCGLLVRRRPDVVYAYHPPLTTGVTAALYNIVRRVPFVYDVEDLWPEAIVAAGLLSENSRTHRTLRRMEDFVYRRARRITVLSQGMKNNLQSKGVPARKIEIISNWGDPDVYRPLDSADLRREMGWENDFVVMMAGNMGLTHGLETVIEAAALLRDHREIRFVFVGAGAAKPELQALAQTQDLERVTFQDQVPSEQAARFINAADVLLIHLKEGDFSVPHRIFSYMLCGKPVIVAATGETAALVQERRCGWVCPPCDPQSLSETIQTVAADATERVSRGRNGLSSAGGPQSRAPLLQQIENTIRAASRTARGRAKR